jgi:homeobox protein YOX1/YHP1
MTSSSKDRYFPTNVTKPRRSSPGDSHNVHGFFSTGQGGRTVLPPLANTFPTPRPTGLFFYSGKNDQRTQTPLF